MDFLRLNKCIRSFVLLIALALIIQPVLAQGGTMTISYRGAGGYYIGDTIIFDGTDRIGNNTLLKISGPNLPQQGVPLYNLDGTPGSGNAVPADADGSWKFFWYSANSEGLEKLVTARYTITVVDLKNPDKTASTSILLKKPEFYINPQPGPVHPGDYVQLNGYAEKGIQQVNIDISDTQGNILHSSTSSVDGSGYFSSWFRNDMQPGKYVVQVSSPTIKNTLSSSITVILPEKSSPVLTESPQTPDSSENATVSATSSPVITQPVTASASEIPLSPLTAIAGLVISGIIILTVSGMHKKQ